MYLFVEKPLEKIRICNLYLFWLFLIVLYSLVFLETEECIDGYRSYQAENSSNNCNKYPGNQLKTSSFGVIV